MKRKEIKSNKKDFWAIERRKLLWLYAKKKRNQKGIYKKRIGPEIKSNREHIIEKCVKNLLIVLIKDAFPNLEEKRKDAKQYFKMY